jgi:hypothetical protein
MGIHWEERWERYWEERWEERWEKWWEKWWEKPWEFGHMLEVNVLQKAVQPKKSSCCVVCNISYK